MDAVPRGKATDEGEHRIAGALLEAQAEASVQGSTDGGEIRGPQEKNANVETAATKDLICNNDNNLGDTVDSSVDTGDSVALKDESGTFGTRLNLAGLKPSGYDENTPKDNERSPTAVTSTVTASSNSPAPQPQVDPIATRSLAPPPPPGMADYKMYASTPEEMAKDRHFYASTDFIISCGCVTIDKKTSKVLLIFNKKLNIYQLPKGRKDIGESLQEAAIRETREETGLPVIAQPSWVPTRATLPVKDGGGTGRPEIETVFCQEPIAVVHSPDPYSGAMKMVFYFLAVADSTETPRSGTQEAWESFSNVWATADEAVKTLTFNEDRRVVDQAVLRFRELGVKF